MSVAGSVLILEDDPDVRELLELVFAADGHRVDVCTTSDQIVDRAGETPGALAIVDFWDRSHGSLAPDEREGLARLAQAVPTILITGRVWAERETCDGLGLLAIVKKPFDVFELAARVSRLVEQRSGILPAMSLPVPSRAAPIVPTASPSVESELAPSEGCQSGLLWSS